MSQKDKEEEGAELGFKESRSMEAPWTMKMQWTFFNIKKPNFIKHTFLDAILGMSKIVRFKVSWMGGLVAGLGVLFFLPKYLWLQIFGADLECIHGWRRLGEPWLHKSGYKITEKKEEKRVLWWSLCFMISCTAAIPFFDIHIYG